MKNCTLLLIGIFFLNISIAQPNQDKEYYFGFNLMPNHTGDLITFAIVEVKNGVVVGSTPFERAKWIRLAAGEEMNAANRKLKNLFIENKVDSCWVLYDAEYYKYGKKKYVGFDCSKIDDLWKLRYEKHPYEHGPEGWSKGHYAPNGDQWAFLHKYYGVNHQMGFFYGPKMWQLFRDMGDEDWVSFYEDGDLTWTSVSDEEESSEDINKDQQEEEDQDEKAEDDEE